MWSLQLEMHCKRHFMAVPGGQFCCPGKVLLLQPQSGHTCLQVIAANTGEVESKANAAAEKEAQLKQDSESIQQEKAGAEAALEEAIPALEEAAAALNDLRREDITEIRSFAKPHVLVQKASGALAIQLWLL